MTIPSRWVQGAGGSALSAAVVASLLIAPPASAAQDGSGSAGSTSNRSAIVTDPQGPQMSLKPGPKVTSKEVMKRNSAKHAGAQPLWVQLPILQRKKGEYSIFASATVSTHRGRAQYRKHTDRLTLSATVLRKGQAGSTATPTYRKRVTIRPKKSGLVTVRIPITKSAARKIRHLEAQQARIVLTLAHYKDTFPQLGKTADLQQYIPGQMTTKKLTKRQVKRTVTLNKRVQHRLEKGKGATSTAQSRGAFLAGQMAELMRHALVVQNNTPFTQHVEINPDIACMDAQGLITGNTKAGDTLYTQELPPVSGQIEFFTAQFYNQDLNLPDQPWQGLNTGNPPSDGGDKFAEDMAESGREILNHITDEMWTPEFYSKKGLIAAGLMTGVELLGGLIKAAIQANNGCNAYGQYWAVTATAKTVGSAANPNTIVGTPKQWASGAFNTAGKGQTSVEVGIPSQHPDALPAQGTAEWNGLQSVLTNAVGQQTNVTYFDNGGMSAPIAQAGGRVNWNGHAAFSQGLIQYLYPNMPSCQNNDCNNGAVAVQLGYLVNGYNDVVGPKLLQNPTATATQIIDPNTGQSAVHLECTIANNGNFTSPFGGSQGSPAAATAQELNYLPGAPGVDSAEFAVSYYAQDAAGNYLYAADSVTSQFPGPIVGTPGAPPPNLKANGDGLQTVSMNQATPTALNLNPADLDNLVNPATGKPAEAAKFGCVVIPVVSWKNMNVTAGSQWGGNWPFPQQQADGWLSSPFSNTFSWPNPVNALNVTWTGDTYLSPSVVSPEYLPPTPRTVSPASGPVTGDTNVTISGEGFKPGSTITIGGTPCTNPVFVDSETLTCVTGAVSAADVRGDVVITNPLSQDTGKGKDLFTFTASVTGVSPTIGTTSGGTALTITGVGFGKDSTVMVGGKSCRSPVVVNTTAVTCNTPAGKENAAVDVEVMNPRPFSTASLPGAYTYTKPVLPALQVDAVFGSPTTAGGKDITIYGPKLTNAATVTVGGKPCTNVRQFTSGSDNYIACVAPAQPAPGSYDVVVSMSGYEPATKVNGLTYT